MKKFKVFLSREYVIEIFAENADLAGEFSELYVSGGFDDSTGITQKNHNFEIKAIIPTINEAHSVEELLVD